MTESTSKLDKMLRILHLRILLLFPKDWNIVIIGWIRLARSWAQTPNNPTPFTKIILQPERFAVLGNRGRIRGNSNQRASTESHQIMVILTPTIWTSVPTLGFLEILKRRLAHQTLVDLCKISILRTLVRIWAILSLMWSRVLLIKLRRIQTIGLRKSL